MFPAEHFVVCNSLTGSFNVQDDGIAFFPKINHDRTAKYAYFAG